MQTSLIEILTLVCLLHLAMPVLGFTNPTKDENLAVGSEDWRLTSVSLDRESGTSLRSLKIEGYASHASVYPGEEMAFHISTSPGFPYAIDIFRTGYYGGKGGRHRLHLSAFQGSPRKTPLEGDLGLRECNWPESVRFTIPTDWASGVYLAKLSLLDGSAQSYIIFIVKSREPADILFQCSDMSWQAYNKWPGRSSLYDHETRRDAYNQYLYTGTEARVSFDRPYALYAQLQRVPEFVGSGEYLLTEFQLAFWLEKEGYHVNYCSNLDTDGDPSVLDRAKVFLSVGHDEYWTDRMLENTLSARGRGLSFAFLSGNSLLHAVDLQPNTVTGVGRRHFARDHRMIESGRELMGETTYGPGNGDWKVNQADHWIFLGTGLKDGDVIPGLVGWEYHGPPFAEIEGLEVVGLGEVYGDWSAGAGIFGALVYPGPKGNWVFNAGTIWWSHALSEPPGHVPGGSSSHRTQGIDTRVQRITKNFLDRCIEDSQINFQVTQSC